MNAPFRHTFDASVSEAVIDSFAGGGGASEGIEQALAELRRQFAAENADGNPWGLSGYVDIAINHSGAALAMHAANHSRTLHLPHNVWKSDLLSATSGLPIGILWASPDCRHHSIAKGGAPVSAPVRDLAWVLPTWAHTLGEKAPRIIFMENVREWLDWGPLVVDPVTGAMRPDPKRKGETFRKWKRMLRACGYRIQVRILRACDYGVPTIRTRAYVIARRDGMPIVWPKATHGDPKSAAVKSGKMLPWPVAADCIDWDLPCPSIFLTRQEARAANCKRPLVDNTMRRLAMGLKRYTLDADEPFIVTCNHAGEGFRGQSLADPFKTIAAARDAHGLVQATFVSYGQQGGLSRPAGVPLHTVTASAKDQNQAVSVFLAQHNAGPRPGAPGRAADTPLSVATASGSQQAVVAANMISLKGSERRAYAATKPHHTVTAGGRHSGVVTMPMMAVYYGGDDDGAPMDAPARTVTAKARFGLVEAQAAPTPIPADMLARARQVADFLRRFGCWDDREFVTREIDGATWMVVDIGMRMLTPRELARAQGFPDSYVLAADFNGRPLTDTQQRHMIGNSVCPGVAKALVLANFRPATRKAAPRPVHLGPLFMQEAA